MLDSTAFQLAQAWMTRQPSMVDTTPRPTDLTDVDWDTVMPRSTRPAVTTATPHLASVTPITCRRHRRSAPDPIAA